MKKYYILLSVFVSFFGFSMLSYSGGLSGDMKIKRITSGGYHDYARIFVTSHSNPDACDNENFILIKKFQDDGSANPFYDEQISVSMLAFSNNLTVDSWFVGCTPDNKYAVISRITVKK